MGSSPAEPAESGLHLCSLEMACDQQQLWGVAPCRVCCQTTCAVMMVLACDHFHEVRHAYLQHQDTVSGWVHLNDSSVQ